MTAAVLVCLAAALTFEPTDIAGLWVGVPNILTGHPPTNFRQADIDRDGNTDLLLPDRIALQRNAVFPESSRIEYISQSADPLCDTWGSAVYLLDGDRVTVLEWSDGALEETRRFAADWPEAFAQSKFSGPPAPMLDGPRMKVRFERFLADLNEDGVPEIVVPHPRGLAVYTQDERSLRRAATTYNFPEPSLILNQPATLWPPQDRQLLFPSEQLSLRYALHGPHVTVVSGRPAGPNKTRFIIETATFTNGFALTDTTKTVAGPFPPWMNPVSLNDGKTAFAGGRQSYAQSGPIPQPVYETTLAYNDDRPPQTFRARVWQPHCIFTDVNGDNRLDHVAEYTRIFDGGLREALMRAATSKDIHHQIHIYYQNNDGGFGETPGIRHEIKIELDQPPLKAGEMMPLYQGGRLINLTQDVTGDGRNDLVYRDRPDRLVVYANEAAGFTAEPAGEIATEGGYAFSVFDVNADGAADIIVPLDDEQASRVYFSGGRQ